MPIRHNNRSGFSRWGNQIWQVAEAAIRLPDWLDAVRLRVVSFPLGCTLLSGCWMKWTQELALKEVEELIAEIPKLQNQRRFSAAHTRWIIRVRTFFEEVFGQNSLFFASFVTLTWERTSSFIVDGWNPEAAVDAVHQEAYRDQLESAKGFLLAATDQIKRDDFQEIYQGKKTTPESSDIVKILNLATRLRKSIHKKPSEEKEVQNAFEGLVIGADVDYSREAERIEYSSKTYVPDFTFKRLDLALEIKPKSMTTFWPIERDSAISCSLSMTSVLSET